MSFKEIDTMLEIRLSDLQALERENEELKKKLEVAKKALELVTNEQNKHWCTWQMLSESRAALKEIGK